MAEGKGTTMKLKVDLQSCKCYKKVKKVLCKFPQIRDQVFDEKQGIVTIKVVCCDPEKLRDKLCCKGGGCIKSIDIVKPPPSPPPRPPPPPPTPTPPPPPPPLQILVGVCCGPCYHGCGRPPICCDRYYVSRCDCDENPQGCTVM